jgi:hypothetical protein
LIEFLFWADCPSHERALADLIAVMDDNGLEREQLRITEVHTLDDAKQEQFIGSPTIRIDDQDIVDPGSEPYGLDCRVYYHRDGRPSPLPDPDTLRDAVAAYATQPGD